ncbi:MAG: c-type cytochrome [Planctomycetaceae bacterium]|jgi:cytochrome c peroxidase|nr:c-type cytochrome [Planctomycetaceae bacterium]MBT6158186.1 c-type cytochrome [Planctomycetaceae bacterium]MBT6487650.1 c-type cytochrome [Planctomycetaceae bacterium]MBT6495752.1 c-type cytochrome [Planctomycetaceae bacterium]
MYAKFCCSFLLFTLLIAVVGCSGETEDNTVTDPVPNTDADSETVPSTDSDDQPAEPTADETTKTDETPSDAGGTLADGSVLLGSTALTAGIPGEGDLTVAQIGAWLDSEDNHAPLAVTLPAGLAAGSAAIVIPEDNPLTRAKIELGRQLYFDRRLSADNTVSCADCHHPDEGFARHTQFGVGIDGQQGGRNSPISYNRILSGAQFWDGRADSLEAQAVGPIASPIEMGNTHEAAVATVGKIEGYKLQFDRIFSDGVTIDNVGRAIASFERAIVTGPSPFDHYEAFQRFAKLDEEDLKELLADDPELAAKYESLGDAKDKHPMSESAIRGRDLFFNKKINCAACHVGANLADEKYHNLGVGMSAEKPDLGRFEVTKVDADRGAFKTPTIRNVALSAPYMHDGGLKTLEEVVEHYNKGGMKNPNLSDKIVKLNLTDQQKADLVEFMKACTGAFPKIETERLPQ